MNFSTLIKQLSAIILSYEQFYPVHEYYIYVITTCMYTSALWCW